MKEASLVDLVCIIRIVMMEGCPDTQSILTHSSGSPRKFPYIWRRAASGPTFLVTNRAYILVLYKVLVLLGLYLVTTLE